MPSLHARNREAIEVPTIPQRASSLTTLLVGVGLLTCIYLAALKLLNLPCPLSGCAEIINTHYGSLFHVPLPLYAIPLWLVLTLPLAGLWQMRVQLGAVFALALGALALMFIQFVIIRGFCPFCTLHAAAALVAAFVVPKRGRAHAWLPAAMLALTLPLLFAVKAFEQARIDSWQGPGDVLPVAPKPGEPESAAGPRTAAPALPPGLDKAAFRWLGDFDAKQSPILIVSFQCSHCLDLLEETLTHPRLGDPKGPKIFVYAAFGNSNDTVAVLAAILSVPGTPREQFATVFARLDSFRDALITHNSKELKNVLGELFPGYTEKIAEARQLFNLQVVALKYVPGRGSPYLLLPDGTSKFGGDVTPNLLYH